MSSQKSLQRGQDREDKETSAMLGLEATEETVSHPQSNKSLLVRLIWSILLPAVVALAICAIVLNNPWAASRLQIDHEPQQSADVSCAPRTNHLGFCTSIDGDTASRPWDMADYQTVPSSDPLEYEDYLPGPMAWKHSPYAGPPSDAKGLAWDELQKVRGSRVSRHEGKQIHLPPGLRVDVDTHATILGVMHNLHCLRMIRQYLYPDYYYSDLDDDGLETMRNHSDHCIETLRESVMCIPDLTPHALEWADEQERIHVNLSPVAKRQCVKWQSLVDWEQQREYHLDDLWEANPKAE